MTQQFVPPENKLEAIARISNLTGSGPEHLGPGSKERKSVLINLSEGLGLSADTSRSKPELGEDLAQHLGVAWDESCFSTGSTITLEGLARLLEGGERHLLSQGKAAGTPTRTFSSPQDEATAILSVLAPLFAEAWSGRECVIEMRDAEDARWAQDIWWGWYFEYKAQGELIQQLGGAPCVFGNTSFDYHLASTWDLKAHSDTRAEAILNDQVAMRMAATDRDGLGFVILSGERSDDEGEFREWQRQARLDAGKIPKPRRIALDEDGDPIPPRRRSTSTVAFRPTGIEIFHIPNADAFDQAVAQGVLKDHNQGQQPSGAPRKPKYKLMLKAARETLLVGSAAIGHVAPVPNPVSPNTEGTTVRTGRQKGRVAATSKTPPGEGNKIHWQYGPEWLSELWGVPISPRFDTRTGKPI